MAGLSIAVTVRIGAFLGAGDAASVRFFAFSVTVIQSLWSRVHRQAKRCAWTGVLMVAFIEAVMIALFIGLRFEIAYAFSADTDVSDLIASTIPIQCIFFMTDGMQATNLCCSLVHLVAVS